MILEACVADCYGVGFEYAPKEFVEKYNTLKGYVAHPGYHSIIPGHYSDDTQMSLAIVELIVDEVEWTTENIAAKFVEVYKRDPIDGYAQGFKGLLDEVSSGTELLERLDPDSDKSGAAMRAWPIGVFKEIPEVLQRAAVQARITHNSINGVRAALVSALTTHYFIYKIGPKAELFSWLQKYIKADWLKPYRKKVNSKGWMSMSAALTALTECDTMTSLLERCIAFTGDVDTVATIALAAGSCSEEIEQDLPAFFKQDLQNGPYGKDYIMALDKRLRAFQG